MGSRVRRRLCPFEIVVKCLRFSYNERVLCCYRKSQKQRNHKQLEQQTKRQQPAFYLHVSECHCKSAQKGCPMKNTKSLFFFFYINDRDADYYNRGLNHVSLQELSKPPTTEAPGSWRTSLRKAGSSVTLGSAGLSDSSQDPSRPTESVLGMSRSASSPRLSSEADTKVQLDRRCTNKSFYSWNRRAKGCPAPFVSRSRGSPECHPYPHGGCSVFPIATPTTGRHWLFCVLHLTEQIRVFASGLLCLSQLVKP